MRFKVTQVALFVCIGAMLLPTNALAQAAELKFEATLVWGTDEAQPPTGKNYKPVNAEILDKLKQLPLRWSHWFEVRRKTFVIAPTLKQQVVISDKCQLDVRSSGPDGLLEVVLIGKGKEVVRRQQVLPKGELLALGGNAPNHTAWLVILKRLE